MLIKRPISPDNLALSIIDYLETDQSAKIMNETEAAQQSQEKKHILVVDDDRTVLKTVKGILEKVFLSIKIVTISPKKIKPYVSAKG